MSGPLSGVSVVEFAGIGPAPFVAMMLADMGARVVRIDRATHDSQDYTANPVLERGRESIALNLKDSQGAAIARDVVNRSDVLVEGFRPQVMERLGLGPDVFAESNPRLVYARITGWGQEGSMAGEVGHDITYTAMTGALHSFGDPDRPPVPPLNLVGDFGGAAMQGAFGIASALFEATRSGRGQVIDANVLDGTNTLLSLIHGLRAVGVWSDERGNNLLDGAAPYYRCYECADGQYVAVGCIERRFFAELLDVMELDPNLVNSHRNRDLWEQTTAVMAERFTQFGRDEWAQRASGRDACLAPVLDFTEAQSHAHAVERAMFVPGVEEPFIHPAPAPRMSRTAPALPTPAVPPGANTRELLRELDYDDESIDQLIQSGIATTTVR
jgi:alpha-methylacyl-CoA racemase